MAEAAVEGGSHHAAVYWDIMKMFDRIPHGVVARRAVEAGCPRGLVRAAVAAYRLPRFLRWQGAHGRPVLPRRGVGAGCGLAMLWAQLSLLAGVEEVVAMHPRARISIFVDDATVSAEDDDVAACVATVVAAADQLAAVVENELGGNLATDKAAVVGSSPAVVNGLRRGLGEYAGRRNRGTVSLGVDVLAGRRRGALGGDARCSMRLRVAAAKMRRIQRIRRAAGARRAMGLCTTGVIPGATYGAPVMGVDNPGMLALRRHVASTVRPSAARRSLTALSLALDDPCAPHAVAAVCRYAAEVWAAVDRQPHALSLSQLAAAWRSACEGRIPTWRSARGPIGVAYLELRRIRWSWPAPFTVVTDGGDVVTLTAISPAAFKALAVQGVRRELGRRVVRSHVSGVREGADRILATPLRVAGQGRLITARDRACMRALFCAGIWTESERYQRGYSQSASCPRCGEPDSVFHRLWECCDAEVAAARGRVVEERIVARALEAGDKSCLFTKAWVIVSDELYTPPALDPHSLRFVTFDAHGHPAEHETAAGYE